jgi:hypothetical protein
MLLAATAISSAATVVLDATKQGATFTGFVLPGGTVTVDTPKIQLSLGPGTYTITDGDTSATGSAWDYSTAAEGAAWLWDFAAVDDATNVVLLRDYIGTSASTLEFFNSRALAAQATGVKFYGGTNGTTLLSATSTTSFSDTFTLTGSGATLDFIIPDGVIADDLGGMTLIVTRNETGVPEPASFFLVATVLAAGCLRLRRRA